MKYIDGKTKKKKLFDLYIICISLYVLLIIVLKNLGKFKLAWVGLPMTIES